MDDVQVKLELPAQRQQQPYCRDFGRLWPRLEIRGIQPPIGVLILQMSSRFIHWPGKFGVDEQWKARAGHMRQCGAKFRLGDHGEAIDSGMNEKALETCHASRGECLNFRLIVADDTAPG